MKKLCKTSEEERKKDWWLNHFQNSGYDLLLIVKRVLDGDEQAKKMLTAWLPAFEDTFTVKLGGENNVRKRRGD